MHTPKPIRFETKEEYLAYALGGIKQYSFFLGIFTGEPASGLPAWAEYLWFIERGLPIPYFMVFDTGCLLEGKPQVPNKELVENNERYRQYAALVDRQAKTIRIMRRLNRFLKLSINLAAILRAYLTEILYTFDLSTLTPVHIDKPLLDELKKFLEPGNWENDIPVRLSGIGIETYPGLDLDLFGKTDENTLEIFDRFPELFHRHFFFAEEESKRIGHQLLDKSMQEKEQYHTALRTNQPDIDLIKLYRENAYREFPYSLINVLSKKSLKPISSEEETFQKESFNTIGRGDPPFPPSELIKPPEVLMRELAEHTILSYKDFEPMLKPLSILVVFALYLPPAEFSQEASAGESDVTLLKLAASLAAHDVMRFAMVRGIPQIDIAFYLYSKTIGIPDFPGDTRGAQASTALLKGEWVRRHRKMSDQNPPILLTIPETFTALFYNTSIRKHPADPDEAGYKTLTEHLNLWLHTLHMKNHWDRLVNFIMGTSASIDKMNEAQRLAMTKVLWKIPSSTDHTFLVSLSPGNSPEKRGTLNYPLGRSSFKENPGASPYPFKEFRDWVIVQVLKTGMPRIRG